MATPRESTATNSYERFVHAQIASASSSTNAFGGLFLFCVIFLHLQHFGEVVHNGIGRTRAFEPFALTGAAFALAEVLPGGGAARFADGGKLILIGRVVLGLSMVIFGW